MAADDAAVVVTLRANLKDYEAALKSAVRSTERAAQQAEKAVSSIGKGGGASKVIEANFQKSSAAIANDARMLQFQLNDIFSGIASGQGVRAVQMQLGQIAQQLSGGGLAAGARTLGAAMVGMINPINLAVVAFGVLASVAASYFSDSEEDAKKATDELRKHADELDKLAEKYGKLFPELQRVATEQRAAAEAAAKAAAAQTALDAAYEKTGKTFEGLQDPFFQLMSSLQAMSKTLQAADLQQAFKDLASGIENHNATSEQAKAVVDALNKIIAEQGGRVKNLATAIRDELIAAYEELDRAARSAGETMRNATGVPLLGAGGPPINPRNDAFTNRLDKAADAIDRFVERVIQAESSGRSAAANPNSSAFGAGQFINSTWLEVFKRNFAAQAAGMSDAAILALRSDVEMNRRMIRAYATENAKLLIAGGQEVNEAALQLAHFLGAGGALKVLNAARGTKISNILSPEAIAANPSILGGGATREDVIAYANRRAAATATVAAQEKALNAETEKRVGLENQLVTTGAQLTEAEKQRAAELLMLQQQMEGLLTGALQGFAHDLQSGKDAGEAFTNMLRNMSSQIADMAIQMLIVKPLMNSIFGGAGAGLTGAGLFHAGGTVGLSGQRDARQFSPALWAGAPRYAKGGMVGLKPGEVPIIAHRGEIIIPNARRMAASRQPGASGSQTVNVRVSASPTPLLDLKIEHATNAAEQRAIARGPAVARDQQRRYGTP